MDSLEAYLAAVEARTEAERFCELAAGAGTPAEGEAAAFELETCRLAAENARDRCGAEWLAGMRCALEGHPEGLARLLERVMGTAAVARLESRAERAEEACGWAVRQIDVLRCELRRLRAENWELAQAVLDLREAEGVTT